MKTITLKMLLQAGLVGASLIGPPLLLQQEAAAQSSTTGAVRGVVRDKGDGNAAVAGAPIAATSPALQGSQLVITDDQGGFLIDSLPPGMYTLTVYWNNAEFTRGNVLIQVGKQAFVPVGIDTGSEAAVGEKIEIVGSAPVVDQGSTKTGLSITEEYTKNIPVARTFGGVLGKAAGSQGDQYGTGFSGSQSVENTYIVEGLNTTDGAYGQQSSNLPTEFLDETEVITGGYNAEYGRSTGAVIAVVTKGGSNEFHGSVFGYYTPGALVASAEEIKSDDDAITGVSNLDFRTDLGAELGGPIIKDKLWFHVGYNPSFAKETRTRTISTRSDSFTGSGNTMAGADGFADDLDGDGFADTTPLSSRAWGESSQTHYFTGKLSGQVTPDHVFQISAFGSPGSATDTLTTVAAPESNRYKFDDGAFDVAAKWTSKKAWKNGSQTQFDAVLGYHVNYLDEQPFSAAQDTLSLRYEAEQSLTLFEDLEGGNLSGCEVNEDTGFVPCPVTSYLESGAGFLEKRSNSRTALVASVSHRMNSPIGYHTFKVGFDGDLSGYDTTRRYTGGSFYQEYGGLWLENRLLAGVPGRGVNDPLEDGEFICGGNAVCTSADDGLTNGTSNRNLGAFIQDSWQIRPNLTLNAGLRWEQQIGYVADSLRNLPASQQVTALGDPIPDIGYKLDNMFAPRIGLIFDPTQEGKAKLFGHWGRFYENVPMDLNIRSFGDERTQLDLLFCGNENGDPLVHGSVDDLGGALRACDPNYETGERLDYALLGSELSFVSPGLKAQYMDELVLGAEYELMPDFKVGANYIHRTLPRVIEDVSTDAGNHYAITNPGENFDEQAEDLQARADAFYEQAMDATGDEAARLEQLGDSYAIKAQQLFDVKNMDKPSRTYDGIQLTASQRPTSRSLLQASYTYSRTKGNFPGLFSTETNQLNPNINSIYDLPDLMANRYGALGQDRPHLLKVDGFYQIDLKKAGAVVLGGSFRAQSGMPHNTLAGHPVYGSDESYLLARGGVDRSPATWQVDVKASYGRKLNKTMTLEGFVDVFNLFNNQAELDADERYTVDNAQPIVGGDMEDLAHSKTIDPDGYAANLTPTVNKNYGNLNSRQAPLSMRFGLRLSF
jgi:outer membrane receptor protein involved in Fe transport